MYVFKGRDRFCGAYLKSTERYTAHYDLTKQMNIDILIKKVNEKNCKYKTEITEYFRNPDVVYRLKKKYVSIDFPQLLKDSIRGINIVEYLEKDFDNLNDFVVTQIKKEPLILNFPFSENDGKQYFTKAKTPNNLTKPEFVEQFTIGSERLHRISATILDEYIILFTENLMKCDQLYDLLGRGYNMNYNLIYDDIENLNPYAFEDMAKEMFDKLHKERTCENREYLPCNKFIRMKNDNKVFLTDNEVTEVIDKITKLIKNKITRTTNNKSCPIYSESLASLAFDKLIKEFNNPLIRNSIKNGELILKENVIKQELQCNDEFNPNLINFLIQFKLCFKDVESYLQQTSFQNLSLYKEICK